VLNHTLINTGVMIYEPEKGKTPWGDKPWTEEANADDVLKLLDGWEPECRTLVENMNKPSMLAIHHLGPLPFFNLGNVALIGDAAHAMEPHAGTGANQALESAYILGMILSDPLLDSPDKIPLALAAFDQVRRPRVSEVARLSAHLGRLSEFATAEQGDDLELVAKKIQEETDWVQTGDVEAHVRTGKEIFASMVRKIA